MASSEVLSAERVEAKRRRDAAIADICGRTGVEPPAQRGVKAKPGTGEYYASEMIVSAWMAEQLARLQGEVDAMKSTKGAKK